MQGSVGGGALGLGGFDHDALVIVERVLACGALGGIASPATSASNMRRCSRSMSFELRGP
jgi:hypothetical protein